MILRAHDAWTGRLVVFMSADLATLSVLFLLFNEALKDFPRLGTDDVSLWHGSTGFVGLEFDNPDKELPESYKREVGIALG